MTESPRTLTPDEEAAVRWILKAEDFSGRNTLLAQVGSVRASAPQPTLPCDLDLVTSGGAAASVRDGPLPAMAIVLSRAGEATGLIHLWVKDGFLSSMEYDWFSDTVPSAYPPVDRLTLIDPATGHRPVRDSHDIREP
jgi:hypothetical protein